MNIENHQLEVDQSAFCQHGISEKTNMSGSAEKSGCLKALITMAKVVGVLLICFLILWALTLAGRGTQVAFNAIGEFSGAYGVGLTVGLVAVFCLVLFIALWFARLRCVFGVHRWDGCKCKICGERRNEQHVWDGCACKRCGWSHPEVEHDWDGCVCKYCGAQRDEGHDYKLVETHCEDEEVEVWLGGHFSYYNVSCDVSTYRCDRCGRINLERGPEVEHY